MAAKSSRKLSKRVPKKTTRSTTVAAAVNTENSVPTSQPSTKQNSKFMWVLGLLIILGLMYYAKGLVVAAVVNGQPVSRLAVISELEKRQGKTTLDSLITEKLILDEARKQKIDVTQGELDVEISKIEENVKAQGRDLDQALSLQGMTRDDLIKQIRFQKLIEKVLADKLVVSDQEIDDYIDQNSSQFPKDGNEQEIRDSVKQQLTQQKFSATVGPWIEELKKNANILYFAKY